MDFSGPLNGVIYQYVIPVSLFPKHIGPKRYTRGA